MLIKNILSLCDYSGNWCRFYREDDRYKVTIVDLKRGKDVRLFEKPPFDVHGILAAPPCTVFASSGARWQRSRSEFLHGLSVVDACLRIITACKPEWWALENPVGKLSRYLGKPTLTFDPCDYGDPYTKKTLLWGDFVIPNKNRVPATAGSLVRDLHNSRGELNGGTRSLTPLGFSEAFYKANP